MGNGSKNHLYRIINHSGGENKISLKCFGSIHVVMRLKHLAIAYDESVCLGFLVFGFSFVFLLFFGGVGGFVVHNPSRG